MTKVNNRAVIRHLSIRELKSNRKMNVVIILSIILTCVLFTALTSIGGTIINGTQQETMRQVGGDRMAGLKCVLPEDYKKVKADDATRDVVYRIVVGNAVNDAFKHIRVEVDCAENTDAAQALFCAPETGRLPEEYDEIAVSTLVLDELGLPYELGVSVPITLDIDGSISEQEFRLCGYWQGERVAMAQECWVSRAFAEKYAPTPTESYYAGDYPGYAGYYMVDFNFGNSWNIEKKVDELIGRLYGDSDIVPDVGINWAYTTSSVDTGTLVGGIALILVIFVAGYLIIYNIFHINVSANIRSYGLLKTIGTTAKQIRKMVRIQAAIYCVVGIPIGLIIGVFMGKVLLKSIMSIMNIYSAASYRTGTGLILLICVIASVFTFLTVIISCRKPCKIAGSVSPIDALRYNETDVRGRRKIKKTARVTPLSVARNNMSRSRKKVIVVVLSLTLSVVLTNTLFTLLCGFDMDKFVSMQIIGDFVITHDQASDYDEDAFFKITPEQIEYLNHMEGVSEINPVYFSWGSLKLDGKPLERLMALCNKYAEKDKYGEIAAAADGEIPTDIYGVPADLLRVFEPMEGELDEEKFKSGHYALVATGLLGVDIEDGEDDFYEVGDKLTVTSSDDITKEYEVMARCSIPYALGTQTYRLLGGQVIIPDSEYFSMTDNKSAISVMINADENRFDDVDSQIRVLTDSGDSQILLKSKQTYMEQYGDFLKMVKLIGGTLARILALIGILNYMNSVVTGIISRKRELAMMNAVGMTGRQLKKMLAWEGVYYVALTAACSLFFGSLLSYFIAQTVAGEMFFFTYHFTLLPIVICIPILLLLSVIIPDVSYKSICKASIVSRLRENE